jgi:GR25 family glycosyltransferase involved in LPS biosynthesis
MKIFVIHYKKLIDRKEFMLKQFEKYNLIDFEFIEIDRDEVENYDLTIFKEDFKKIHKSQMAITLSHIFGYKKILDKYENALIFEDDAILCENFIEIYNYYLTQLPENYDMLFIGNGGNLHIKKELIVPNKNIYLKSVEIEDWAPMGAAKCTESYLVSKKCAKKLLESIEKIKNKVNLPIDWWLTYLLKENNLIVYWAEPTIVTQGTQNGMFIPSH